MQHWPHARLVVTPVVEAGAVVSPVEKPELTVRPADSAGLHSVGEGPQRLTSVDAAGALPGIPAAADVDLYGWTVAVEADLEQPVGRGRPTLDAPLPFGFPLLGCRDRCPHLVEGEL